MLKKSACLLVFAICLAPSVSALGQIAPEVVIERGVAMKTRDGVNLRADIYRPAGEGAFPVLLQRTPYNKENTAEFARKAAARGYMVVTQDVRGRYTSEGDWYPFKYEIQDGFDTVEWASALPHSNGMVGMFGGSYVGATQMLAAISHPPHLAGICPVVTASNYHENWTYQGGAFEQWFNESWTSGLAQDTFSRAIKQGTNALVGSAVLPLKQYPLFNLQTGPGSPGFTRKLAPYFLDWLDHPSYDGYWQQWSIEEQYELIHVPALTVAAWYDIFLGGSLKNYMGMKARGGTEAARTGQKLLVTIGGHAGGGRKIGAIDFGPAAEEYDENAVTLEWYDFLLQGKQNRFATGKPVRIFVMGKNRWRDEDTWPVERARTVRYYLHSSGRANSISGNGWLSTAVPKNEASDRYLYDPANPAPTVGGPLCCDGAHLPPRPPRPGRGRNPPGCAGLFHSNFGGGFGGHRAGVAGPLRQILGRGH